LDNVKKIDVENPTEKNKITLEKYKEVLEKRLKNE